MKVKCEACGHSSELLEDVKTTWKCSCGALRPECGCDVLNVVEADG